MSLERSVIEAIQATSNLNGKFKHDRPLLLTALRKMPNCRIINDGTLGVYYYKHKNLIQQTTVIDAISAAKNLLHHFRDTANPTANAIQLLNTLAA